jgi:hypothetical protein
MRFLVFCAGTLLFAAPLLSFSQTTSTVHSGQYALQLNRTTFSVDSGFDREAPGTRVPVTAGHGYLLSFWARNGQGGVSFINRVALAFFDSGGTYINPPGDYNFNNSASIPTVWTQFTETVTTAPATAATMNVAFRLDSNSSMVLDDVSVKDASAGNAEVLTNGGFETWPTSSSPPTDWRFFGATDGSITRLQVTAAQDWQMYDSKDQR